jgi:hypothetical protein
MDLFKVVCEPVRIDFLTTSQLPTSQPWTVLSSRFEVVRFEIRLDERAYGLDYACLPWTVGRRLWTLFKPVVLTLRTAHFYGQWTIDHGLS